MSAYLVVNRQYFGTGPTSTLYGWEIMGAMLGHAVATGLAGLVLALTGSFRQCSRCPWRSASWGCW